MNTKNNTLGVDDLTQPGLANEAHVESLPLRPTSAEETGLSSLYLADLLSKILLEQGVLDLHQLSRRSALAGSVVEAICHLLRREGRAEVRGQGENGVLRYGLTELGRAAAMEALARDGYAGPAPVPLEAYTARVRAQALSDAGISRERVISAFADTVIEPALLDQLGPGLHSGRAMFIHGEPGTGKSYIARRLVRLLPGEVLIPHAILAGGKAVRCFDPAVHSPLAPPDEPPNAVSSLLLAQGHDPRFVRCRRPCVVAGGELTMERLEIQYDGATHIHQAPIQLLANNGMLVIDDLGRQRMPPMELFNRWIVPLEERRDFLALANGYHFSVPFDVALVFSTNLDPLSLADAAFLRRIGYKIRFAPLEPDAYRQVWALQCRESGIPFDPTLVDFVIYELHARLGVPLLACHPRDLLGLAADHLRYWGGEAPDREVLAWAWQTYFGDFSDSDRQGGDGNTSGRNAS
ncbi:AAA family ATPase [Billgrantia antri]|uniref:AAA family ATPase n=1 Tax=Halomonas sulfidivorans TaxID=2733488 RepID=A0ABX7WHL6_9GAMM|nr:AAA family ATPase [Halomonas sulfidivorans]QTP58603.1 AAA family ATPase [Halomonas sulfidivorans]